MIPVPHRCGGHLDVADLIMRDGEVPRYNRMNLMLSILKAAGGLMLAGSFFCGKDRKL